MAVGSDRLLVDLSAEGIGDRSGNERLPRGPNQLFRARLRGPGHLQGRCIRVLRAWVTQKSYLLVRFFVLRKSRQTPNFFL